jgi:hypothetical protein
MSTYLTLTQTITGDGFIHRLIGERTVEEWIHKDESRTHEHIIDFPRDEEKKNDEQYLIGTAIANGDKGLLNGRIHNKDKYYKVSDIRINAIFKEKCKY